MSSSQSPRRRRTEKVPPVSPKANIPPTDTLQNSPQAKDSFKTDAAFWSDFEPFIPLALLLLAGFTRFYRLDRPFSVAFDETHFGEGDGRNEYLHPPAYPNSCVTGNFTSYYLRGNYFFDMYVNL
jgi:hypothetical protein